ncbi:MAG: potassium channel protein [Crocinitomicaceae bacterium]|nr:potassium channel protein [Crocinitomicaceae bacterium]
MLFNIKLFSKIYYFLLLLLLVAAGGTTGYMIIEGMGFIDSFYMTIITISTVGFGEVVDLTVYGKLFTAFLIISSFGTFAYAITSITTYLVGGEYRRYFKEYKTMQETKKMRDHVIICGYGRVGIQVARDLYSHDDDFVVLELSDDAIQEAKLTDDFLFLEGDSTHDEFLKLAGIKHARAIITCLPKDADNIYVVLAAREFNSDILIVSRASHPSSVTKLKMAGATNVIMPDVIGGSHMASLIVNPDVMEFIDNIRVQGYYGSNVESIAYNELPPDFRDKTIKELEEREITGATIIGFKAENGDYVINPPLDTVLVANSKLFVLGSPEQIKNLVDYFRLAH